MAHRQQTYKRDPKREAAALAKLAKLHGDTSEQDWQDDLPLAPDPPESEDDTQALLHPRK